MEGKVYLFFVYCQDIAAIPLVAMIPLLATSSASTTMGAFATVRHYKKWRVRWCWWYCWGAMSRVRRCVL